jgi:hypothetical protein
VAGWSFVQLRCWCIVVEPSAGRPVRPGHRELLEWAPVASAWGALAREGC